MITLINNIEVVIGVTVNKGFIISTVHKTENYIQGIEQDKSKIIMQARTQQKFYDRASDEVYAAMSIEETLQIVRECLLKITE